MEDNIGFKDIERKTEKIPMYVKNTLILTMVAFVICVGLMLYMVTIKGKADDSNISKGLLDGCNEKELYPVRASDGVSCLKMDNYNFSKVVFINDIAAKEAYIVLGVDTTESTAINMADSLIATAGDGVIGCKLYENRERLVVEYTYDNYYDLNFEKSESEISVKISENDEIPVVVIRTDEAMLPLCKALSVKLEEDGYKTYLVGNEVTNLSEEDYLSFIKAENVTYYIEIEADNKSEGGMELVAYCNSRYFMPEDNSVAFSDRIVGAIVKDGLVKAASIVEGLETDVISQLTIPSSHIVFKYGKANQLDVINSGDKKEIYVNAIASAFEKERN